MIKTSRKIRLIQVRKKCGATPLGWQIQQPRGLHDNIQRHLGTFKGIGGEILEETGLLAWGYAGDTAIGDPGSIPGLIAASSLTSI